MNITETLMLTNLAQYIIAWFDTGPMNCFIHARWAHTPIDPMTTQFLLTHATSLSQAMTIC